MDVLSDTRAFHLSLMGMQEDVGISKKGLQLTKGTIAVSLALMPTYALLCSCESVIQTSFHWALVQGVDWARSIQLGQGWPAAAPQKCTNMQWQRECASGVSGWPCDYS